MQSLFDLIVDIDSVTGKLVTTVVIVGVAMLVGMLTGRLLARRTRDRYRRYYVRKGTNLVAGAITLVLLGVVWRPFAGQLGLVLGLITAGVAFAMQELIGALAGWFNIVSGSIYRVGDRVQVGGVRGDVIDLTPLRTKVMEIGSGEADDTWVRGRQYTGRIVAISNKATFTEPVFNYSAAFDFIWEEVTIPVAYPDRGRAEEIMIEEMVNVSTAEEAQRALTEMIERYPVAGTDIEPRVFFRATDNYVELAARFVVPVRLARRSKDELTRRVLDRFDRAGIAVASQTADLTLRSAPGDRSPTVTTAAGSAGSAGPEAACDRP